MALSERSQIHLEGVFKPDPAPGGYVGPEENPVSSGEPDQPLPIILAKWAEGALDAQEEQWVQDNYPDLVEWRRTTNEEEFGAEFVAWWLVDLDWATGEYKKPQTRET